MDTSPGVPCKRLQLSNYPSPLNLSPSLSPLMNNSPLHQSFSTCSRKSSSTQSEFTPLSSPSGYLQSTNPFAINYDSGNCEHWQSNSGSNSNCSSACHSPLVMHGSQKGGEPMVVSLFNSKMQGQVLAHGGMAQDDLSHHGSTTGSNSTALNSTSNQYRYLSPSPGIVINEESKMPTDSVEIMTEAPTPLSPKGLQFRQKLFPQNLPSPIPRSLPYSSTSSPVPPAPSYATHSIPPSQRGALMAPASPKSHQQHSSSLHHDKHLSPFKSDHFQGRILRTAVKNRLNNHLRQKGDPLRNPTASMVGGVSGGMGGVTGGIASDHLTNRFITSHASNSGRLVSSSPLVKLSMSSSLDEGGGAAGFRGGLHMPPRRVSDASVESGGGNSGREECLMESSDCESVDSVEPGAVIGATTTVPGHGQEEKQGTAPELTHMTS